MSVNNLSQIESKLPPQFKSARNYLIETTLLLVICILFSWFLVVPKYGAVTKQKASLAELQSEEADISSQMASLKGMIAQLTSDKQKVEDLDEAVPLDGSPLRLRSLLQKLAESVGLTVSNINVEGNSDVAWAGDKTTLNNIYGVDRALQRLSGTVAVVGNYDQLKAFLQKLENSGRVINVNSVNVDSTTNGDLSVLLSLNAYYFGPKTNSQ